MRKAVPAVAIAAILLPIVALAALSTSGTDDSGEGGSAGSAPAESVEPLSSADRDSAAPALPRAQSGGDPESDRRDTRFQQRSASLTLAAPRRELDSVANQVGQVASDLGGFVRFSTISSNAGGSLELRVPTRRLDTAIERLSDLGRVRELSRQSEDITRSVVSARDRLSDARAERKALLEQLADATTVNETESIRARLDIVAREIAAARASLRRVDNRASFADVRVALVPSGASDEGAWTPGDAFDDALRVLEVVAGVALIAAAVLLPLALIWLLAWLARRGVTRRRRERALDMA